jgi:hypothetical protein
MGGPEKGGTVKYGGAVPQGPGCPLYSIFLGCVSADSRIGPCFRGALLWRGDPRFCAAESHSARQRERRIHARAAFVDLHRGVVGGGLPVSVGVDGGSANAGRVDRRRRDGRVRGNRADRVDAVRAGLSEWPAQHRRLEVPGELGRASVVGAWGVRGGGGPGRSCVSDESCRTFVTVVAVRAVAPLL